MTAAVTPGYGIRPRPPAGTTPPAPPCTGCPPRPPAPPAPAAAAAAGPEPLHAACELARMTNCGYCWARPQQPCTAGPGGAGYHLARFARAARRGLITPAGFDAALAAAGDGMYSGATVVFDVPGGAGEVTAEGIRGPDGGGHGAAPRGRGAEAGDG
jgi:hypothetical protein